MGLQQHDLTMKSKLDMIVELQEQMATLIEDNMRLVKQMGELVKQQAALDRRLDKLEKKKG